MSKSKKPFNDHSESCADSLTLLGASFRTCPWIPSLNQDAQANQSVPQKGLPIGCFGMAAFTWGEDELTYHVEGPLLSGHTPFLGNVTKSNTKRNTTMLASPKTSNRQFRIGFLAQVAGAASSHEVPYLTVIDFQLCAVADGRDPKPWKIGGRASSGSWVGVGGWVGVP